ncbi:hypothetical protein ppKF707_2745 [Metapseudomonas furukawaii]|uniref:Uncharacterized protein n=1 Tax=Metapseudomonas furukawaii TaxID=1149133 RepID=A0AAD1FDE7_METFU|nr:hypothetical protein ppKF707_2745 [Pseudomonas furukawaii]BAU72086.1 hypothetical protein KF707C_3980 [Pseudomonas furukawaii]
MHGGNPCCFHGFGAPDWWAVGSHCNRRPRRFFVRIRPQVGQIRRGAARADRCAFVGANSFAKGSEAAPRDPRHQLARATD